MKIVISIFALPYEIDELENTLTQLRNASYYLSNKNEWFVDVTMSMSSELVNWKKSALPQSYFTEKLLKLSSHCDWAQKEFQTSTTINGCVSQRNHSLNKHSDTDYFIWLDTDIIFDERTLAYFESVLPIVSEKTDYSIVTPEIVRIWDTTWDSLVNENFIDKPLDYHKTNDPYKDSGVKGEIELTSVSLNLPNQPRFKFAGGWFTCLSGDLVRRIGVPESFGHYGYEDTFIMWGAEKLMMTTDIDIQQFKIKNLVVCENYKYRSSSHILNHISAYDKRDEYKKIAYSHFNDELNKLT
jgi:hypothetical protein